MYEEQPHVAKTNKHGRLKKHAKRISWKGWLALVAAVVLLAGAGWFAYDYSQVRKENERLSDPQQAAKDATDRLIEDVGKLVQLPQGETPTIATVSDVTKLKNQAFFAKAQNGDKVLIYTQAKRAILYRPSTNKVIEIAPVNIGDNNSGTSGTTQGNGSSSNNR